MTYAITQDDIRGIKIPRYTVTVDGEEVGTIAPLFKSRNSNRPYGYQVFVQLEFDETDFDVEYRTAGEAKKAVADFMERNGVYA